jgi:ParB-like chromosome segregation protein Spo0J
MIDFSKFAPGREYSETGTQSYRGSQRHRRLIDSLGLTQDEVARRVGRDRPFITNYPPRSKLPTDIQALLEEEKLSFTARTPFGSTRSLTNVASLKRSSSTTGLCERQNNALKIWEKTESLSRPVAPTPGPKRSGRRVETSRGCFHSGTNSPSTRRIHRQDRNRVLQHG